MKSGTGEILPVVSGQTPGRVCLVQYVFFTSSMVVITMTATLLVANINILQNLFSTWYMSLAFVLIGAVFAAVLLLVQNVESQFPVNYTFLLLTVAAYIVFSVFFGLGLTMCVSDDFSVSRDIFYVQ
uniref:Uncharacterized protein n=1 Tax=Trichobilharzia regenti TaxID=157069 RepID=A0AA85J9E0_TRIRE|nr:unnamed protein product [Trichobilharzia regenti]